MSSSKQRKITVGTSPSRQDLDEQTKNKLALAAGMGMMSDFQKELFPIYVDLVRNHIEDEFIEVEDPKDGNKKVKLTRHKVRPKEAIQLDKYVMGEDIPEPLPDGHTPYTWTLCQKMKIHYTGFTDDMFWNTPLEDMEFWEQLTILKRQGFRRDQLPASGDLPK